MAGWTASVVPASLNTRVLADRSRSAHDSAAVPPARPAPAPVYPALCPRGTTREGIAVPPSILLLHRHRELDRDLGPWDVRPPRRAAAPSASALTAQAEP